MNEKLTLREVIIDYTNHRGERAKRRIVPVDLVFCPQGTEYHSEPGWYLRANDLDKGVSRDFAMKDIHSCDPAGRLALNSGEKE